MLNKIDPICKELGFSHWGFTSLAEPLSLSHYESWLQKGHHGSMQYLEKHLPQKKNPELLGKGLRSAVMVAFQYLPHPKGPSALTENRIARYAQGDDYHFWLKEKLEILKQSLQELFPEETFVTFTDSGPVLERDLAVKAGLGWVGKNTCVIHPKEGSFFLIGEVLTSIEPSKSADLVHDFCGTCNKCMEVCPTKAIEEPRKLNATKCISYLTIESRTAPAKELRHGIGDWLFGCDLCQSICPWNNKVFQTGTDNQRVRSLSQSERSSVVAELREILVSSNNALERKLGDSPMTRAGGSGLKRNALVVAGNLGLHELRPEIESFLTHEKWSDLARWSLSQLP